MPSLALACRLSAAQAPQPLPRRVRNILRKYQATALIPGSNGVAVHSFAPGNYIESTGQTLSPVDGDVGLVVDAAGTVGPELATSWATIPAGWSVSSGVVSKTASTLHPIIGSAGTVVAGRTYRCELNITSQTVAGSGVSFRVGGAIGGFLSGVGPKSAILIATSNGAIELIARGATGDWQGVISNITVRELPGNHATQPTTQYKPKVRRGLVNELLWSSDFTNAAWNKTGTTVAGNKLVSSVGDSIRRVSQNASLVSGQTYTAAMIVEKAEWNYAYFNGPESAFTTRDDVFLNLNTGVLEVNTNNHGSVLALGNGRYLLTYTRTATASISESFRYGYSATANILSTGDGTSGIYLHSAALFAGTVTAEEILANGGIPVTTTAPASSAVGPQYWQFDGNDDRLTLSSVPFQTQDDFAAVFGVTTTLVDATTHRLFSIAGGVSAIEGYIQTTSGFGRPAFLVRDDDGVGNAALGQAGSELLNRTSVLTFRKVGNVKTIRLEGSVVGSNTTANGSSTNTTATICATSTGYGVFGGGFAVGFLLKGTPSDAELLTLERFAAKLQGRNL